MSRELPARPSLDHLKKQAKVLLRELRRQDPVAKLAAAQHALAHEYGFTSWRELKAYVQKVAADQGDVQASGFAFERYTSKARLALFFSRDEASQVGSTAIDPEHVLLGSIRAGLGLRGRLFERAGLSVERARTEMRATAHVADRVPYSVEIPFSNSTKQVLLAATAEADRQGHESIGIAHVVLGMLDRSGSVASSLLAGWGMTAPQMRKDIAHLLNEESEEG
jgi:Clp amino terminal domain, pathogenicity island component